eukprot:1161729-Pelagomonas_calceolata.AAC.14
MSHYRELGCLAMRLNVLVSNGAVTSWEGAAAAAVSWLRLEHTEHNLEGLHVHAVRGREVSPSHAALNQAAPGHGFSSSKQLSTSQLCTHKVLNNALFFQWGRQVSTLLVERITFAGPACEGSLTEARRCHVLNNASPFQRDRLVPTLLKPNWIPKLIDVFKQAEDLDDSATLAHMYGAVKGAIMLNDAAVLEELLKVCRVLGVVITVNS